MTGQTELFLVGLIHAKIKHMPEQGPGNKPPSDQHTQTDFGGRTRKDVVGPFDKIYDKAHGLTVLKVQNTITLQQTGIQKNVHRKKTCH